ncbi:3-keto-5-aminohexanoate cleavage protein [Pseudotabrizicola sp. L79]|uniref:3-keto-5-aminohexanoate cleavage protein n=1 Tax=Pseudotabrizicola sp. L79 TaxID=3118402 RepID=UPI002F95435C
MPLPAMPLPFVMVAPNGARRGKSDHPALPITLPEIIETARSCYAAGAHGLHLHIRDDQGAHSLDSGRYREALAELGRALPELLVQITTEAVGLFSVADQLACLAQVRPAWASIAVREIARDGGLAPQVYATCAEAGTRVQHIVYDPDDLALLHDWQSQGIIQPGQDDVLCVLGRYSQGQQSLPSDLAPFLAHLPPNGQKMLCAFGGQEHACLAAGAAHGFALRVGFENSLTNAQGTPHQDNAASVAALIALLQRTPA